MDYDSIIMLVTVLLAFAGLGAYMHRLVDKMGDKLRGEFRGGIGAARAEMGAMRDELRGEFREGLGAVRAEMGVMRDELRVEIGSVRAEIVATRSELKADIAKLDDKVFQLSLRQRDLDARDLVTVQ